MPIPARSSVAHGAVHVRVLAALWLGLGLLGLTTLRAAVFTVTNASDSGLGTLRWALTNANADAAQDEIQFAIDSGSKSITLLSGLPTINQPVTIDGSTQPGYAGTPLIELNGTSAGSNPGLYIVPGNCVVRGLVLNRFPGGAIRLLVGDSNTVENCFIGTDAAGTNASANGEFGIWISSGSVGNVIGGTNASQRNVISGNAKAGIYLAQSPGNFVRGNHIGLNAAGTAAVPNGNNGIVVDGSNTAQIGGAEAGQGNLISGNRDAGVYVKGSSDAMIQGNTIGLSSSGTSVSNWADGIRIEGGAGHRIGGVATGAGNVVSGNGAAGIFLRLASGSSVEGNRLGTDPAGTLARGNSRAGVTMEGSSGCVVGGTAPGARNVIAGNRQDGIYLTNCQSSQIEGNWIGLDATGNTALANAFNGVTVVNSTGVTLGGTAAGAGNVVSGNTVNGVSLLENATGNSFLGNWIGLNAGGNAARPNLGAGIYLASGSNFVGGASAAARNVISGNGVQGIYINGAAAAGNVIQGNYIGTTPSGTGALGNTNTGIYVLNAPSTVIGGVTAGAGNLISGSVNNAGIFLHNPGTRGTLVQGNFIGTHADGNAALPNYLEGIYLENAGTNLIGGGATGAGNLIAGNRTRGIFLKFGASGNTIQGNRLGTKADGTNALPNGLIATQNIEIESGCNDNQVGGTGANEGNRIAFNQTYAGVRVRPGALRNAIRGNAIFSNAALGIDLEAANPSLNDACDGDAGANQQQNFPVLTKAAVTSSGITIQGDLNSTAGQTYGVDFFASPLADPSGYGEGEVYLGSAQVSIPAGPSCSQHFVVGLARSIPPGWVVTATATDAAGNTSEFSAAAATEPYPALAIAPLPASATIQLSWTNSATGYVLTTATNLVPPVLWTSVTNAPVSSNGQWRVSLPRDALPQRYYRLGLP